MEIEPLGVLRERLVFSSFFMVFLCKALFLQGCFVFGGYRNVGKTVPGCRHITGLAK